MREKLGSPASDHTLVLKKGVIDNNNNKTMYRLNSEYNIEEFLAESLESLLKQGIPEDQMQVILIDDGIWKALSFALIVIAVIAIGYKELKNFKNEEIKSIREKRKTK